MAKYKILSGTWFDRKEGKCKVKGDDVDFTEKQVAAFGKNNLRSYAAIEAEAKAAEEAAAAEAKAAEEAAKKAAK